MFYQYVAILGKELLDAMRDFKSLSTALFMPVFFAIFSLGSLHFIVNIQHSNDQITLPVQGMENAKPLIDWLTEAGITVVPAPENPEDNILSQASDVILIIPENFAEDFREQRPAILDLLSDHSNSKTQGKVRKVRQLINQWSMKIGAIRLLTRNISPAIANPAVINDVNVSTDQRVAAKILASFPMFTILIVFASGIGMASDMTAGERERKSLEPLLINPVPYAYVFLGKWSAAVLVTFCITLLGIGLQILSINIAPLDELGIRLTMGLKEFVVIVAIVIPVIFLASALQLLVSLFAKSFKDAQSYNSLIVMLPVVPGIYLAFNSGSAESWQMLVPVLGPTALIVDVIGGEPVMLQHAIIASGTSIAVTTLLVLLGILLLKREKTIFS
ncbi:MAG: ABC transporter permease [Oceanicoccus sp.]